MSFLVACKLSEWHQCNTKCGPGNQTRTIVTQTLNGGQECESDIKECNLSPCPGMKLKKTFLYVFEITNSKIFQIQQISKRYW